MAYEYFETTVQGYELIEIRRCTQVELEEVDSEMLTQTITKIIF